MKTIAILLAVLATLAAAGAPPLRGALSAAGALPSGAADDIVVHAALGTATASAKVTDVKVEFKPDVPIFPNANRHVIGVRESVGITWKPLSVALRLTASNGGELGLLQNKWRYQAPLLAERPGLVATCGGCTLPLNVEIKEPESIYARNAEAFDYGVPTNIAGGAGMELALYVCPTNVSFMGIAIQEVPSDYHDPWGYFANEEFAEQWSHTRAKSAGVWHNVQLGNLFMLDVAEMGDRLPCMRADGSLAEDHERCWISGGMNWMIPVGWNETGSDDDDDYPVKTFATYWQCFTMSAQGSLKVEKFARYVERGTNDIVSLNGNAQRKKDLRPR